MEPEAHIWVTLQGQTLAETSPPQENKCSAVLSYISDDPNVSEFYKPWEGQLTADPEVTAQEIGPVLPGPAHA